MDRRQFEVREPERRADRPLHEDEPVREDRIAVRVDVACRRSSGVLEELRPVLRGIAEEPHLRMRNRADQGAGE